MRYDDNKSLTAFFPRDTASGKTLGPCLPTPCPSHTGITPQWIPYSPSENVQRTYREAPPVRLLQHVMLYWETFQTEALLLWLSLSAKLTWMTCKLVQKIFFYTSERETPVEGLIKKKSTVITLITELVLLTGLTKLPVANCHPKCRCSPFCLGLQLRRAVPFIFVWCSPGLSVWTPNWSKIPGNTLVFTYVCCLNRCRKSKESTERCK